MSREHEPAHWQGRLSMYAELVREMRAIQKRFFRGEKTAAVVRQAKALEARVDRATDAILNPPEPTLFDREPARMPYRSECHCSCHSGGGAMHVTPCCQPDPGFPIVEYP